MIMTIHGSKGLEFEHVILLDRLKGDAPDRSLLLYDYDESLHVKEVYYKMSKRENFDESYKIMLEKQKKLSTKDKMNILYVALTRAVESMIVIRKPKGSIFDLLGITPITIGSLNRPVNSILPNSSPKIAKPIITHYGVQEINRAEEEEEKDYDAMTFGLALHYTLEMMSSFSIMGLAEAIPATKNLYGLELSETQFKDIKNRILSLVTNEKFKKFLKGATINKEQSLSFENEFKQIDLLLEYDNSCMVLDYKSSKKYHLKHQSQVRHYKRAIYNITGKYTRGVIVYLLDNMLEMVEV
jgi:exodeoxyribonuclease V beta subunit